MHPSFCYYYYAHFSTDTNVPEGGAQITHRRYASPGDAAFGMLLRSGVHRFAFTVIAAPEAGAAICFGVADATVPNQMSTASAFGVRPDGTLEAVDGAVGIRQGLGNLLSADVGHSDTYSQGGDSRLSVVGTRVVVMCDLSMGVLSFALDGGPAAIVAGVSLPAAVRPWLLVTDKGVTVKLDSHRHAASLRLGPFHHLHNLIPHPLPSPTQLCGE